jgi:hypothetical protein
VLVLAQSCAIVKSTRRFTRCEFAPRCVVVTARVCITTVIEDLKRKCVLCGAWQAIMMRTRPDWLGPSLNRSYALDLSNGFRFGRTTAETCTPPALPNAEDGCDAVKANFIDSLGLTWKESAALMGVHTLGRARKAFSGYEGWWNEGPEGRAFNNSYYISLLAKGWEPRNVGPNKNLWIRSDSGSNAEIMLSSDLCLLYEVGQDHRPVPNSTLLCPTCIP